MKPKAGKNERGKERKESEKPPLPRRSSSLPPRCVQVRRIIRGIDSAAGISRPNLEPYRGQAPPSPPPRKKTGLAQPEPEPSFTEIQEQKGLNAAAAAQAAAEAKGYSPPLERAFSPPPTVAPRPKTVDPMAALLSPPQRSKAVPMGLSGENMMSFAQATSAAATKKLLVKAEASYLSETSPAPQGGRSPLPPGFTPPPMPTPSPTQYHTPNSPPNKTPKSVTGAREGTTISPEVLTAVSQLSPSQVALLERSEELREESSPLKEVQLQAQQIGAALTDTQSALQQRQPVNLALVSGSDSERLAAALEA